jgi:radical SAM superfamily enzyme YgiQ (UPF0313 family)
MRFLFVKPLNGMAYQNYHPDLGIGYLSTSLKRAGHQTDFIDMQLQKLKNHLSESGVIKLLIDSPADVIGFKCFNSDLPSARRAIVALKEARPETPLVIGGPAPSGLKGRIFDYLPLADFAFDGEAETGLPLLLEAIDSRSGYSDVPGLIWREEGEIKRNPNRLVKDIDSLGSVDWELLRPDEYPVNYCGETIVPIMISRGCPYHCHYCQARFISGLSLRLRSMDAVIDEISYLNRRWGFSWFSVLDDNITADREAGYNFAEGVLSLDTDFRWMVGNGLRVETLDVDLMKMFERSGCYYAFVGIESGSQRVLDLMNRGSDLDELVEILYAIAANVSIRMFGYFILGYPGETVEEAKMSLKLARQLPLDRASFFNFIPLPGTPIWNKLEKEGKLENFDIENNYVEGHMNSFSYSSTEQNRLKREGYLRFYARPKVMLSIASDVKSFKQFYRLLNRIYSVCAS